MLEQFSSGVSKMSLEGKLGAINQLHQHIGTEKKLCKWQQTIAWFFPNQKKRAWLLLTAEKVYKQFIKTLTLTLCCVIVVGLPPSVWKEVENKPTKLNLPLVMSQWDWFQTKKRTSRSTKDAQDGFLAGVSRSENDFFVFCFMMLDWSFTRIIVYLRCYVLKVSSNCGGGRAQ